MLELSATVIHLTEIGVAIVGIEVKIKRNIARIKFKVASGKPKRKLQNLISQDQEEKENSKKSKLFKRLPHRRAGILKTHEGRLCHHVEFTLCHMVAYRPIRHFTPVNSICVDFH